VFTFLLPKVHFTVICHVHWKLVPRWSALLSEPQVLGPTWYCYTQLMNVLCFKPKSEYFLVH